MHRFSTADRLKQLLSERNLKQADIIKLAEPYCKKYKIKLGRNDLSQYISGKVEPRQNKLFILAKVLDVNEAWLMGYDVPRTHFFEITEELLDKINETDDDLLYKWGDPDLAHKAQHLRDHKSVSTVPIPIVGEIAAGYEKEAFEDLTNGVINIPLEYLKGRNEKDFFILKVVGDSMYPMYQEGDYVLILKQSTLNYSGSIGAVIYDNNIATLKKVEYATGENWMRLVPINPAHAPKRIEGPDLEKCRVLGIPKLLIREINE